MNLFEKIEQKGLSEKKHILAEAKEEAQALYEEAVSKAKAHAEDMVRYETLKANRAYEQKKNAFDLEKRQAILYEQSKQIDAVIDKLRTHLQNLKGKALLDYSVALIKLESIEGDEVIMVNKADYDKYLEAFSSAKKGKAVVADKLNKALGNTYNLTLSDTPVSIHDGFLIVGSVYDLNFSVEPFLKTLRAKHEKHIFDILF